MIQTLIKSFYECPVLMKGDYPYFIHPLMDGALPIDPKLLRKTCYEIIKKIYYDLGDINLDLILAPEAMAIPIATVISDIIDVPYVVIRKRKYELPGEIEIQQQTGYSKNLMYINSVKPHSDVIILDDVISTGGTLKAIIDALKTTNVNIIGSYVIAEKHNATQLLQSEGYNIQSLVNIEMGKNGIKSVNISK